MKTIIPMLMLTVTASVFGQASKEQVMQSVVDAVGATAQNGIYIEGEMIGPGIVNNVDKPLYIFIVHVLADKKEKDARGAVDAMVAKAATALKDRPEQLMIKIVMTQTRSARVPTGETVYYARPLHITSWCSGGTCSSTVYGGGISTYDRTRSTRYVVELAHAAWRNY
jgi:hypothetical protein